MTDTAIFFITSQSISGKYSDPLISVQTWLLQMQTADLWICYQRRYNFAGNHISSSCAVVSSGNLKCSARYAMLSLRIASVSGIAGSISKIAVLPVPAPISPPSSSVPFSSSTFLLLSYPIKPVFLYQTRIKLHMKCKHHLQLNTMFV